MQDWGVTYAELEPYYDKFDKLCGTSGKAGNLRGQIQSGGNPFEGARADEYPTPPMAQTYGPTLFGKAAAEIGLSIHFRIRLAICRSHILIHSARNSANAPTVVSAKNSAAATIRKLVHRRRCYRT